MKTSYASLSLLAACAGLGESDCDRASQSATASGHECGTTREVKEFRSLHVASGVQDITNRSEDTGSSWARCYRAAG